MSLDTRTNSALFKRAEQLKRWEESETNRETTSPKDTSRKIQFSAGCVFLAACASGDKEEVQRLIQRGADINTADADEMTALHQACIDNNLEMVEFLVKNGADLNRGDNDGWTALHATSNCGFVSIARYLIENGANVAAVNSDAELPIDVAASDDMEDLLQEYITAQGIDCDEARNEEETVMLEDAKRWLNSGRCEDVTHPKTGATALHVAAAKGYIKVMSVLLQAGVDVNNHDNDGWTPLHAAAYWGQREACELLIENFCDMDIKNYVAQTAFDVADSEMQRTLEELKKKQAALQRDRGDVNIVQKKEVNAKKRISANDKTNIIRRDNASERHGLERSISEEETVDRVKKVELEIKSDSQQDSGIPVNDAEVVEEETTSESTDDSETSSDSDTVSKDGNEKEQEEKRNRVNKDEPSRIPSTTEVSKTVPNTAPSSPSKTTPLENNEPSVPLWRRPGSFKSRATSGREEVPGKALTLRIGERESPSPKATTPTGTANRINADTPEVVLRRTQSFEADEKFRRRYMELQARIKAGSCPSLHACPVSSLPTRSASLREKHLSRRVRDDIKTVVTEAQEPPTTTASLTTTTTTTTSTTLTTTVNTSPSKTSSTSPTSTSPLPGSQVRSNSSPSTPSTPTTPGGSKLSPGNIFKNFFKSFVPPVRDEESETQRKAHAKRVRETRRSTQGVTLEELKSAEQLIKKRNQQQLQQLANEQSPSIISTPNSTSITATITTAVPTVPSGNVSSKDEGSSVQERRPSWRLRVDNVDRSKFLLEDARNRSSVGDTPNYIRRTSSGGSSATTRPSSAPVEGVTADTTVTIALRRQGKPPEDKEQDKENDIRNAQATQGVIQRRRRPKRRSTGVVHVDMDEIDPDRQEKLDGDIVNNNESGNDYSGHSSRLSSVSGSGDSPAVSRAVTPAHSAKEETENGELDYKKLYEEAMLDNERLREKLKKTDNSLSEANSQLEKISVSGKSSLSELEKRERRAMERKLSEMEEELKQLQKLKAENERLKAENRALTRVVSKLTNSANAGK